MEDKNTKTVLVPIEFAQAQFLRGQASANSQTQTITSSSTASPLNFALPGLTMALGFVFLGFNIFAFSNNLAGQGKDVLGTESNLTYSQLNSLKRAETKPEDYKVIVETKLSDLTTQANSLAEYKRDLQKLSDNSSIYKTAIASVNALEKINEMKFRELTEASMALSRENGVLTVEQRLLLLAPSVDADIDSQLQPAPKSAPKLSIRPTDTLGEFEVYAIDISQLGAFSADINIPAEVKVVEIEQLYATCIVWDGAPVVEAGQINFSCGQNDRVKAEGPLLRFKLASQKSFDKVNLSLTGVKYATLLGEIKTGVEARFSLAGTSLESVDVVFASAQASESPTADQTVQYLSLVLIFTLLIGIAALVLIWSAFKRRLLVERELSAEKLAERDAEHSQFMNQVNHLHQVEIKQLKDLYTKDE